jgi:hypothetical protein
MESHTSDVGRVAVKSQDCVRVRRLDIIELDRVVSSGGEVALVGRYAETIHLGIWVWDCARADAAEGLPEAFMCVSARQSKVTGFGQVIPDCVVISGCVC